jgi:CDP-4-dehydro-6-deoxyglucose reductase
LPKKWQQEHDNFKFIPVLSEPKPEHDWHGRTGLVTEAILQDYQKLDGYQIYACGPPLMVDAGRAPFMAKGLPEDQYFSDAFLVAPYKVQVVEPFASSEGVTHD